MIDWVPLLSVALGAFGIAGLQTGLHAVPAALFALRPALAARPEADRIVARSAARAVVRIAREEGLPRVDRAASRPAFAAEAIRRLADCTDIDGYSEWLDQTIGDRADRHDRIVAYWDAVADAAPALGMAGTILGLIGMFARMNDPDSIGPAMALALMTTLYGLVLANLIAAPVARRLARLSAEEIAWQHELAERLLTVARREATASPSFRIARPRDAA